VEKEEHMFTFAAPPKLKATAESALGRNSELSQKSLKINVKPQ